MFACGIWEEDILIADIEELNKVDASEVHPRRLNAKEVLIIPKDGELYIYIVADGAAKNIRKRRESTCKERESLRRISRRKGRVST